MLNTMTTLALACALLCAAMAPVATSTPKIKQLAGTWEGNRSVAAYTSNGEGLCVDAKDLIEVLIDEANLQLEGDTMVWGTEVVITSGVYVWWVRAVECAGWWMGAR